MGKKFFFGGLVEAWIQAARLESEGLLAAVEMALVAYGGHEEYQIFTGPGEDAEKGRGKANLSLPQKRPFL